VSSLVREGEDDVSAVGRGAPAQRMSQNEGEMLEEGLWSSYSKRINKGSPAQ
jgi:hypothetical protein